MRQELPNNFRQRHSLLLERFKAGLPDRSGAPVADRLPLSAPESGFALAPILYLIALAGIAGTVLFTGYTQILRSNVEITADNNVRNQIRLASEVMASRALINGTPPNLLPQAVVAMNTLDAARLPKDTSGTTITSAGIKGTAHDVGGLPTTGGIHALDPWGRYYIYCRWESPQSPGSDAAMSIISAGADGKLATTCDDTLAHSGSDDRMEFFSVANVLSRAATWQAQGDNSFHFGVSGDPTAARVVVGLDSASADTTKSLDIGGDGRFRGSLTVDGNATIVGTTTLSAINGGAGTFDSLAVTHNAMVGGNMGVTGDTTLTGALGVSGATTLGTLSAGASTLGATSLTTLTASGLSTLSTALLGGATASVGVTLKVKGPTVLEGLTANATTVTTLSASSATVSGAVSAGSVDTDTMTPPSGTLTVNGDLSVTGTVAAATGSFTNLTVTNPISGSVTGTAGGVTASGVTGCCVPLSAGGTGYGASSITDLTDHLLVTVGTYAEAHSAELDALAGLSTTGFVRRTGAGAYSAAPILQTEVPAFTGATNSVDGTLGGVPKPVAGQQNYVLTGGGTWVAANTVISPDHVYQDNSGIYVVDDGTNPGVIQFKIDGSEQARITGTTSANQSVRLTGGASGSPPPEVAAYASSGNVPLRVSSQGTGDLIFRTNGADQMTINGTSGVVTATTFAGNLTGNADTATKLATARTIGTSGDISATATSFDGSANITIPTTVIKLQGVSVSTNAPGSGDVLTYNGTSWAPASIGAGNVDGGTIGATQGTAVVLPDGSVGTPALRFLNSPHMGLYRYADNQLGIATASVERMHIDASGNVGIGTASPSSQLDIFGTATGYTWTSITAPVDSSKYGSAETDFQIYNAAAGTPLKTLFSAGAEGDYANNGSSTYRDYYIYDSVASYYRFAINSSGDIFLSGNMTNGSGAGANAVFKNSGTVGIGTISPATKLDVAGGVKIANETTSCSGTLAGTIRYTTGSGFEACHGGSWIALTVAGGSASSVTNPLYFTADGSNNFAFGMSGSSNSAGTNGYINRQAIRVNATATTGVIQSIALATAGADRLTIGSTGVVAVTGTTASSGSLTGALTVAGGLGVAKDLYLGSESNRTIGMDRTVSGTTGYSMTLAAGAAKTAGSNLAGGDLVLASGIATGSGTSNIYFQTSGSGSSGTSDRSPTTQMMIDGTGNVAIGSATGSAYRFYTSYAPADTGANSYGIVSGFSPTYTASNTYAGGAIYGSLQPTSTTGTVSGVMAALQGYAIPKSTNAGTYSSLSGLYLQYGQSSGGGTITNLYGINLLPYHASGTVTNSYGIYLTAPSTGGTVTNEYGIWQASTTANNYFGGKVNIGKTSFSSTSQYKVEINSQPTDPSALNVVTRIYGGQTLTTNNVNSSYGLYASTDPSNAVGISAGNYNAVAGEAMYQNATGGGSANNVRAGYFKYGIESGAVGTSSVTNAMGVYVVPVHEAGTITNSYGLYIAAPTTGGTVTNEYGIHQASTTAINRFGGSLSVGQITSPVTKLDVAGGVKIANETTSCSGTLAGTIRYTTGSGFEACHGGSWVGLTSAGGSASTVSNPLYFTADGSNNFALGMDGTSTGTSGGNTYSDRQAIRVNATATTGVIQSIALATGGADRLKIDSSGQVGIGGTPNNYLTIDTLTAQNSKGIVIRATSASTNGNTAYLGSGGTGHGLLELGDVFLSSPKIRLTAASPAATSYINTGGNFGLGTTSATYDLSLGGDVARVIGMERTSTAATSGFGLTLRAGGAKSAGTNLNGGDLTLMGGIATGTGTSNIYFQTATAGSTGTADVTPTTKMTILGSGNVGIGTTTPSYILSLDGQSTRTIGMERQTTSATAGNSLTISASGAKSGGTDLSGGDLILASGTSTGSAGSNIRFQIPTSGGTSGTTDAAPSTQMILYNGGTNGTYLGIGTGTSSVANLEVRSVSTNDTIFVTRNNSNSRASIAFATSGTATGTNIFWSTGIQNSTTDYRIKSYDGTTNTVRFAIDTSGNVGIGTTSQTTKLDVAGPIRTESDTTSVCSTVGAGTIRYNAGIFEGCDGTSWSTLGSSAFSNPLYFTADASNNFALGMAGTSTGTSGGNTYNDRQAIRVNATATTGVIQTINLATAGADRLTINSTGQVGIGSIQSGYTLTVNGRIFGGNGLLLKSSGLITQTMNNSTAGVASGVQLASIVHSDYYGVSAQIDTYADSGTHSATSTPGRLVFSTTPVNSLAAVERMRIDSAGATTFTSSSANALTVGANGATNPAFNIDASTASAATGLNLQAAAAGNGVVLQATSSGTNEAIYLKGKGSGIISMYSGGSSILAVRNYGISATALGGSTNTHFLYTGPSSDTGLTASAEAISVHFDMGQTRQHGTGAIATQRDLRISPSTHSFSAASTITNAVGAYIDGPPIAGTNATITNSHGLYVGTQAVNGGGGAVTNGYGLTVYAPSGATNNYSAIFMGGNVGVGTAAPSTTFDVAGPIRTETDSSSTCSTVGAGTIRWNGTTFQGCDGTNWATLGSDAVAATNPLYFTADGSNNFALGMAGTSTGTAGGNGYSDRQAVRVNATATTGVIQSIALATGGADRLNINSSGYVGLGTNAPTDTLTLPSTATGIVYYNTSDQTTNYERVRQYWSGNVFKISGENGGTGNKRAISIATVSGRSFTVNDVASSSGLFNFNAGTSTQFPIVTVTGTLSATGGTQTGLSIAHTLTTTGTAGYTGLLINPTITTVGSGSQLLLDAQASSVSKFKITSTGTVMVGGSGTPSTTLDVAGPIRTETDSSSTCSTVGAGTMRWNGTTFQGCDGTNWATLGSDAVGATNPLYFTADGSNNFALGMAGSSSTTGTNGYNNRQAIRVNATATTGVIQSVALATAGTDQLTINSSGVVAVTGTTASSGSLTGALTVAGGLGVAKDIYLGSESNRTIGMDRTVSGTTGYNMTLAAGAAKSGGSNLNGGDLYLVSGTSTGTGNSNIYFQTSTGTSGTADAAPTTRMILDGSGRLALGTSVTISSTTQFIVRANGVANTAAFSQGNTTLPNIVGLSSYAGTASNSNIISFARANGTGNNFPNSGDRLGELDFKPSNGNTGSSATAASIYSELDGTMGSTSDAPGRLVFATTPDGSGTLTERMRIDNSGNVGIGASSSSNYRLYVSYGPADMTASNHNIVSGMAPTYTASNTYATSALYGSMQPTAASGNAISGVMAALQGYAIPKSTDAGTYSSLSGLYLQYGQVSGAGTVSNLYGIQLLPYHMSGTVTNSYGIYLTAPATGGTVTNEYGIYQASTTASNIFAGSISVGQTSAPTANTKLDVAGAIKVAAISGGTSTTTCTSTLAGTISYDSTNNFQVCISMNGGTTWAWQTINVSNTVGNPLYFTADASNNFAIGMTGTSTGTSGGNTYSDRQAIRVNAAATTGVIQSIAFATGGADRMSIDSSGNVGIGSATSTGVRLLVNYSSTDSGSGSRAAKFSHTAAMTTGTNANTQYGTFTSITPDVRAAANFTGSMIASNNVADLSSSVTGGGTLPSLIAVNAQYGIDSGASGTVTSAYGVRVAPQHVAGTITNSYALYLLSPVTGGTVTNEYGVYQQSSTATNVFMGNAGLGVAPTTGQKLSVYSAPTDPSSQYDSAYINMAPIYTASNANSLGAINALYQPAAASGTTINGIHSGVKTFVVPKAANTGTITNLYAIYNQYGNASASGAGNITNLVGYYSQPYHQTGTITNSYGIYLNTAATGGTVTNEYGIYQVSSTANNYFSGKVNIGNSSFTNSTYKMEVATTPTDPSALYVGARISASQTLTASNANDAFGLHSSANPTVGSGFTASGRYAGVVGESTFRGSSGGGTASDMRAGYFYYGINTGATAGSAITNAYGVYISPIHQAGTITNSYGLYLSSPSTGGTVTTEYGIYQASTTAKNALLGTLSIGTTPGSTEQLLVRAASGNDATVNISRGSNSDRILTKYTPNGTTSASNVIWYTGLFGSSNNFAFSYYDGSTTNPAMYLSNSGNVAIGQSSATTKLDVAGPIRTQSDTTSVCSTVGAGTIRYNAGTFQGCDGTSWTTLGSSAFANPLYFTADGSNNFAIGMSGTSTGTSGGNTHSDRQAIRVNATATTGVIQSIALATGGADYLTINSSGVVALAGTTASTSSATGALTVAGGLGLAKDLYLGGTSARTIAVETQSTASTAGSNLTIAAGGSSTGTDLSGGNIVLASGAITGSGSSKILFQVPTTGSTGTTANAPTTQMVVYNPGSNNGTKVGIGTGTTAGANLEVRGTSTNDTVLISRSAAAGGASLSYATNAAYSASNILWSTGIYSSLTDYRIRTWDGTTSTTMMSIDTTGKVGIGTTSQATKLDVAGGVKVANESGTCSSTLAGTIRYDSTNNFQVCLSTNSGTSYSWTALTPNASGTGTYVAKAGDTMTGTLLLPDGAVGAPAIAFSSETGLGIYRASTNDLRVGIGGNPYLIVNGNGIAANYLNSFSGSTYARIAMGSATTISHNIADANAALTVSQSNASATGNILTLANSGGTVASVTQAGYLQLPDGALATPSMTFGSETGLGFYRANSNDMRAVVAGAPVAFFQTGGLGVKKLISNQGASYAQIDMQNNMVVTHNQADALAALSVTQSNASSTGNILTLANSGGTVASFSQAGVLALANTTASTSSTTGALTVAGGLGLSKDLNLGGESNRTIAMDRTSAGTTGYNMTVSAGGAKSAGTNLAGGSLYLTSGTSTGSGSSTIYLQTSGGGSSGTADTALSSVMLLDGAGRVAMGYSPVAAGRVHINANSDTISLNITQAAFTSNNVVVANYATAATTTNTLQFQRANGTGNNYPNSGDRLGEIDFKGYNQTGGTGATAAAIYGELDAASSSVTDMPGRIIFATALDGTATLTSAMTINNTGAVTITGTNTTASSSTTTGSLIVSAGGAGITGDVYVSGIVNAGGSTLTSDRRLKDNIETFKSGLDTIKKLRGVTFTWKKDGTPAVGLIAQEVEEVLPQLVTTDGNGMKAVMYANLVGPIIEAVKELSAKIDDIAAKLADLLTWKDKADQRLDAIEAKLGAMNAENARLKDENAKLQALTERLGKVEAKVKKLDHARKALPAKAHSAAQ